MKSTRFFKLRIILTCLALFLLGALLPSYAQDLKSVIFIQKTDKENQEYSLSNKLIQCLIRVESGRLFSDEVKAQPEWLSKFKNSAPLSVQTDADFLLDVMWTDWSAPGKTNNAENPVELSKKDFQFVEHHLKEISRGAKELSLIFKGMKEMPLEICLTYRLEPDAFYIRRKLAVRDTSLLSKASASSKTSSAPPSHHFLRWTWPRHSVLSGKISIIKPGGFGQPAALLLNQGGAFFGLEYPTSINNLRASGDDKNEISCGQEMGLLIADSWMESEWVVEGISPDQFVKHWFWKYLDSIRLAPLKPYLLYNSWYDLRAPDYVKIPQRSLTEKNILRSIESFRKRMFEKRGLALDAFVLDDGWDAYRSDWVLSRDQFPSGLAPFRDALKPMGTRLGLWIGPTGGYSNRKLRLDYMKSHGYEVIGDQMCVAGANYKALLKKRVTDFVRNDGVGYYKWDGIQFSCSEPGHGHLPDIYSRRAVMETVIDLCRSVRAEDKDVFLNVTSGTWLSPWWLKYANTIWMQGADYGYADVPSISLRDAAMTYRDSVLYFDLLDQEFWFPIANLMTHGIIKGHLQMLGGREETLDKFTSEVLFYFARGISMWELYISPDLLTEEEWDALAAGIRWAKDRFDILRTTEMVGGDPDRLEPYGYVHFKGKRGILAVRNPGIEPKILAFKLSPALGLDADAKNLVLERVYPLHWISPKLFETESNLEISLQGYETAIYELYPLEEAQEPFLAGVIYDLKNSDKKSIALNIYEVKDQPKLLNPEIVRSIDFQGKKIEPDRLIMPQKTLPKSVNSSSFQAHAGKGQFVIDLNFEIQEPAKEAFLAFLLQASEASQENKKDPAVKVSLDGKKVEAKIESQKGSWWWYKIKVRRGSNSACFQINPPQDGEEWKGFASAWIICSEKPQAKEMTFILKKEISNQRLMPPLPFPAGIVAKNYKVGGIEVKIYQ